MSSKAQTSTPRGRGRPKRVASSPAATPVASATPGKRGRRPKAAAVEVAVEPPKKRGRPAKARVEETMAAVANTPRRGRPKKVQPSTQDAPLTPKKRGRPAKNASIVDLKRVAGSPHVAKSSSPRTKHAPRPAKATAPPPRSNPRMRSKLRTRIPVVQKMKNEESAPQPAKKRGRPAKTAQAPAHKETTAQKSMVSKTKAAVPRKRRGYTALEIPDKFAVQVQRFIQDLYAAEMYDAAPDEEEDAAQVGTPTDENVNGLSASESEEQEQEREEEQEQQQEEDPETEPPSSLAEQDEEQTSHDVDTDAEDVQSPAELLQQDEDMDADVDIPEEPSHSPTGLEIEPIVHVHEELERVVDVQVGGEEQVYIQEVAVDYEMEL